MPYAPLARQSKDAPYNGERLLNLFPQTSDVVSQIILLGRSGLDIVATCGNVRAIAERNGTYFVVGNSQLWSWDGATLTSLGFLIDDAATTIATSTAEVAVAAGGKLWLYNGSALTTPDTGAMDEVRGVVFLAGYFIVWGRASGRDDAFQVSGLRNGSAWDPLDVLFAESRSDRIEAIEVYSDRLFVLGAQTTEIWYNAGAATGVMRRDGSPSIAVGCKIGATAVSDVDGVYWLGSDGQVYATQGVQPTRISTMEIENQLANVETGFIIRDRGQKFYCLRRTDAPTLCYGISTGLWCERNTGVLEGPWIATASHGDVVGTTEGLATQRGYTDAGDVVRAEVITPPIENGGARVKLGMLELKADTGRHDMADEPTILMSTSRGGGAFGAPRPSGMGVAGDRNKQIKWVGIGASRWWQLRFRITDPAPRDLYGVTYG